MAKKNKYIDYGKNKRERKVKNGTVLAIAFLCIAMIMGVILIENFSKIKGALSILSSGTSTQGSSGTGSQSGTSSKYTGKTTNRIVVLMFHSVNYEKNNILRVPKTQFAAEMKWLYTNGYHTLSLDELYDAISNKKPVPEKSVVLTFDDGYSDNYRSAFPIIKHYHFKATVFMITSKIDKFLYLKSNQLREMDKNGFQVESHTVTHPHMDSLSYKQQYKELKDSKAKLTALLGHPIDYMAYPYGGFNSNSIKAAKKAGYKLCFRMKGGMGTLNDNRYEFPRAFVGENLKDFIRRVKGTANYSM